MSGVVYCVLCTRYSVCRVLGIRSIVYWVLGHWVLGPYALDVTSRATALVSHILRDRFSTNNRVHRYYCYRSWYTCIGEGSSFGVGGH